MTVTRTRQSQSKTKLSITLPGTAAAAAGGGSSGNPGLGIDASPTGSNSSRGRSVREGDSPEIVLGHHQEGDQHKSAQSQASGSNQWPFSQGPPSPVPPQSPSQIHPSYKDFPPNSSPYFDSDPQRLSPYAWSNSRFEDSSGTTTGSTAAAAGSAGGASPHSWGEKALGVSDTAQFGAVGNQKYSERGHEQLSDKRPRPFYASQTPGSSSSSNSSTPGLLPPKMKEMLDTPTAWLIYYFAFNLGLTLYNKLVLVKFPFPWALTAVHTLCGGAGSYILKSQGVFQPANLSMQENAILVAFSVLYTVNIAVSNLSLNLVTVPFHQVVRAMTPLFTIGISVIFLHKRHTRRTYLSLIPVVMGVAFATYGDYYFTAWGFFLTVLGTVLAALKTIVTNQIQVGRLKLHPLDLLLRMSPLAFIQCVVWSYTSGELSRVRAYGATEMDHSRFFGLALNGVIAFFLNIVSFSANKKTSALTMTVAANVKQVLTILLAVYMFDLSVTMTNLIGISLTLGGGAWYAQVEFAQKQQKAAQAASALGPQPGSQIPLTQVVEGGGKSKS